jgi:hypothetical protein
MEIWPPSAHEKQSSSDYAALEEKLWERILALDFRLIISVIINECRPLRWSWG